MSRRLIAIISFIALLLATAFLLRATATYILRDFLQDLFSKETGCGVSIGHGKLNILRGTGYFNDVRIRCGDEPVGFYVKRISTEISYLPLLHKEVLLNRLVLEGGQVESIGSESAFIRTLDFIIRDEEPEPPSWHSFISENWEVTVPKIEILSQLQISPAADRPNAAFTDLAMVLSKDNGGYEVSASAKGLTLRLPGDAATHRSIKIGAVTSSGVIGGGGISNFKAAFVEGGEFLSAAGFLSFSEATKIQLNADVVPERLRALLVEVEPELPFQIGSKFRGELLGPIERLRLAGDLNLEFGEDAPRFFRDSCRVQRISSQVVVDGEHITAKELRLNDLLVGEFEHSWGKSFSAVLDLNPEGAPELLKNCLNSEAPTPLLQRAVRGTQLKAKLDGSFSPPVLAGDFTARVSIDPEGVSLPRVNTTISGKVVQEGERTQLVLNELSGKEVILNTDLDLSGDGFAIRQFNFRNYPVKRLADLAEGIGYGLPAVIRADGGTVLNAELFGKAVGKRVQLAGAVKVNNFSLADISVAELSVNLAQSGGGTDVREVVLTTDRGVVRGDSQIASDGKLSGKFSAASFLAPYLEEPIDLDGRLAGTLGKPEYDVVIRSTPGAKLLPDSELILKGVAGDVRANFTFAKNIGRGEFETKGDALKVSARFDNLPLDWALRSLDGAAGQLSCEINYQGRLSNPLAGSGTVAISQLNLTHEGEPAVDLRPVSWSFRDGALNLGSTELVVRGRTLNVNGRVSERNGWDVTAKGIVPLEALELKVDDLEELAGDLHIKLRIVGPMAEPAAHGELQLDDGRLAVAVSDDLIEARNVRLKGVFDRQRFELSELQAELSDGTAHAQGEIRSIFDSPELNFDLSFDNVLIEPIKDAVMRSAGKLHLSKSAAVPAKLSGEIFLQEGNFDKRIQLTDIIKVVTSFFVRPKVAQKPKVRAGKVEQPLLLELKLFANEPFIVDTNVVGTELYGELLVTGDVTDSVLQGEIHSSGGSFYFGAQEFSIFEGQLLFAKGSVPEVRITAETMMPGEFGDSLVQMRVSGALADPKVGFTSDGGLSEREIVSRLGGSAALGVLPILGSREGENRSLADVFDPTADLSLAERFSALTGFSTVEVRTGSSIRTGRLVPMFRAEKPVTNRLDLILQSEITTDGYNDISVEYPITERFVAVGGWRSSSVTGEVSSATGSTYAGGRYFRSFPSFMSLIEEALGR